MSSSLSRSFLVIVVVLFLNMPDLKVGPTVATIEAPVGPTFRSGASQSADPQPHHFLRTVGGFSTGQIQALERGEPLARVLDTDKREVAVVGAIRIQGPVGRLFDRYRDVAGLKRHPIVLDVGTFAATPGPEDLDKLTLEEYDLQTIRECKPGDCGVRLSDDAMARFQREVDWRAADWRLQAGSLWRRLLLQYVSSYLATGALAEYHNKEQPLRVADEFATLFDESRDLTGLAPDVFARLRGFPKSPLAGAETILYWTKENFGIRPVLGVTHLTIYPQAPGASRLVGLVATRQIYAAHYFDAGLGLTLAFDDGASGFYMLTVNRARTRSLTGVLRMPVRGVVQRRSRDALEELLRSAKVAIEKV